MIHCSVPRWMHVFKHSLMQEKPWIYWPQIKQVLFVVHMNWKMRDKDSFSGRSATSELMQELVKKLNGAYVLLAGTLLLWARDWVNSVWEKWLMVQWLRATNQLRDQNTFSLRLIANMGDTILSYDFTASNWKLWNWMSRGMVPAFDWCASDRILSG